MATTAKQKTKKQKTKTVMANILKPQAQDSTQPEQLNSRVELPKKTYIIRCKKADFKISAKGNPMIVLVWELCRPETVSIAGRNYSIAGVELRPQYLTLNEDVNHPGMKRFFDLQTTLNIEAGVDLEDPVSYAEAFVGKIANAICDSEEYIRRESLTEAEVAAGKTPQEAEPLRYEDGTEVKGYNPSLRQVLESSSVTL